MTATKNQSITSETRTLAAKLAQKSGENTVVYEGVVAKKKRQLLTTESTWAKADDNRAVKFLALVDVNGNYVD